MQNYRDQFAKALQGMGQQQDPLVDQYKAEVMKQPEMDANKRSLVALADNLTGSNFTQALPNHEG